jgi:hypothetical protein
MVVVLAHAGVAVSPASTFFGWDMVGHSGVIVFSE